MVARVSLHTVPEGTLPTQMVPTAAWAGAEARSGRAGQRRAPRRSAGRGRTRRMYVAPERGRLNRTGEARGAGTAGCAPAREPPAAARADPARGSGHRRGI